MLETARKVDASHIADMMVQMAFETQKKYLDSNLVKKAVEYFIESDFGQAIVKKINNIPVAALFLNYQNSQIWWIISVFVAKPYRGQGIFDQLFNNALKLAKKSNVQYLRLYVEKSNFKATNIYQHLGMYITNDKFYGYDLTCEKILFLDNPLLKVKKLSQLPSLQGMTEIYKQDLGKNKGLGCFLNGKLQGYCEYFVQFSEWRYGLTIYISCLFIKKEEIGKQILTQFFQYLRRYQQIPVRTIRLILQKSNQQFQYLVPKIKQLNYRILQIKIDQKSIYAKL